MSTRKDKSKGPQTPQSQEKKPEAHPVHEETKEKEKVKESEEGSKEEDNREEEEEEQEEEPMYTSEQLEEARKLQEQVDREREAKHSDAPSQGEEKAKSDTTQPTHIDAIVGSNQNLWVSSKRPLPFTVVPPEPSRIKGNSSKFVATSSYASEKTVTWISKMMFNYPSVGKSDMLVLTDCYVDLPAPRIRDPSKPAPRSVYGVDFVNMGVRLDQLSKISAAISSSERESKARIVWSEAKKADEGTMMVKSVNLSKDATVTIEDDSYSVNLPYYHMMEYYHGLYDCTVAFTISLTTKTAPDAKVRGLSGAAEWGLSLTPVSCYIVRKSTRMGLQQEFGKKGRVPLSQVTDKSLIDRIKADNPAADE